VKKLPQITALFWVLKIAATTLGETGGDEVAQTLHVGYLVSFFLFIGLFLVAVTAQLRARKLYPPLYWTVIIATSTAGTTLSDFLDRSAGLGYLKGSLLIFAGLLLTFLAWRLSGETFSVEQISTLRGETFYWTAILFSNTLGTAFGDFLSDSSGLHYWGSALLIATVMAAVLVAHFRTSISTTVLFWVAFVLTRPLGATAGDLLWKPHTNGGLGLGSANVSYALVALIAALSIYTMRKQRQPEPTFAAGTM
jgi:uncharacterized membrane-anchored protein